MFKKTTPKPGGDAMAEQMARANALRKKKPAPVPTKRSPSGEFPAVKDTDKDGM